jgi:ParB family chromosome partitioning protein
MSNPVNQRHALGRGIESLLKTPSAAAASAAAAPLPADSVAVEMIPVGDVYPNPTQPRRNFDDASLLELADSIRQQGILQPLLLRKQLNGYQILAGERRYRAAILAGLAAVPALVRTAGDQLALELAIVENLQRQDLNALEQARAYHRLLTEFGLTQEQIGQRTGKDRASVANFLRLLKLDPQVQAMVGRGELSMGHAKVLLSVPGNQQLDLAQRAAQAQWSVRQLEEKAAALVQPRPQREIAPEPRDPNVVDAERNLAEALGTKVRIKARGDKGTIEIDYYSVEDFQRIYERFVPSS